MRNDDRLGYRLPRLQLRSPIVASAAPHNNDPDIARRLERAGVGAIVLPSLFEEKILAEEIGLAGSLEQGSGVFAEALDHFPPIQSFAGTADRYVTSLRRVKASVTIPVIASLNGSTLAGWVGLARRLEDAGAARSNSTCITSPPILASPRPRWNRTISNSSRPSAPRPRSPWRSSSVPSTRRSPNFAGAAASLGIEGLVLFNRFYDPVLDPESIEVMPRLELSQPWEMRLPVRWIAPFVRNSIPTSRWRRRPAPTRAPTWPRASWSAPMS